MLAMRTCLALAAVVGGGFVLLDREVASAPDLSLGGPSAKRSAKVAAVRVVAAPALPVMPVLGEEIEDEIADDPMRGHAPITDAAELAFVFSVDDESYVRLATDERATSRGAGRLTEEGGVYAVIAPVAMRAMPEPLRAWFGRSVLVDGTCHARVVGFAEVSRISGDASDPWGENGPQEIEAWTVESVTETGVVLAAKLDGCTGTWARSEDYSPAVVITKIDAPDLEQAALENLLARDEIDPTQDAWTQDGGAGDWRDAADIVSSVYHHPLTDESWVFVQASKEGHCGDPGFSMMAAYRATADGRVRRVAELNFGSEAIGQVVDLDGDGQPELFVGDGQTTGLVDLLNERHDSIGVDHRSYGCGC